MNQASLEYEDLRLNLISALQFIAATGDEIVHARYDDAGKLVSFMDLNNAVAIIFDMVDVADEPEKSIGLTLFDEHEVDLVKLAMNSLDEALPDDLFQDFDAAYVQTPDWQAAIAAADTACRLLEANDRRRQVS